jgi:hypothetical protein
MVRAAVDFLRGACPLADDFLWLVDDEELFFLADEGDVLCFFVAEDDESSADKGLLCSNNSAARPKAVNRLREFTECSVTRLDLGFGTGKRC